MGITNTKPTHEQAQLHLRIYDLRRESRLRQARDWFFKNYFADTLEEAIRIAAPGTEVGALLMMVVTYWDQACALLNYGLLHEDLFFETSGEFFAVWERVKAAIPEGRERFANRQFLAHLEQAAQRYETWIETRSPGHVGAFREFSKQMRAQAAKAQAGIFRNNTDEPAPKRRLRLFVLIAVKGWRLPRWRAGRRQKRLPLGSISPFLFDLPVKAASL